MGAVKQLLTLYKTFPLSSISSYCLA